MPLLSLSLHILPVAYCGLMLCRGLRSISALTNLRHLNLSDTAITDHSVCSLSRMKQLKYLNLSHSGALQTLTPNAFSVHTPDPLRQCDQRPLRVLAGAHKEACVPHPVARCCAVDSQ